MPGDCLAVEPLNWAEMIEEDDEHENWVDPGAPTSGRSLPRDGNDNDNGDGEEDMQGREKGTGKAKDTPAGKRNGKGNGQWKGKATEKEKGKGKGNSTEKSIDKQPPGRDDISYGIVLQWQKQMYEADCDTEVWLQ